MRTWVMATVLSSVAVAAAGQPLPRVTSGRVERMERFPSRYVDARHVDVWLPDGYRLDRRYNVLYMHDGQMLFDASTTWNGQAWNVDVTMARLMREGRIPDTIVVGVWNNGELRHAEYFPQKFLPFVAEPLRSRVVAEALKGTPLADRYLRFLVEELKPAIDAKYATRPGPEGTFIMGASMGGMISIYAMSEYPQVFGAAAGMSTHWVGIFEPNAGLPLAAFTYLRDRLASPESHRLYMDRGTRELDALYGVYQAFVDEIVRDRGFTSANWTSRTFEGAGHNERDWAARFEIPVLFLMGTP